MIEPWWAEMTVSSLCLYCEMAAIESNWRLKHPIIIVCPALPLFLYYHFKYHFRSQQYSWSTSSHPRRYSTTAVNLLSTIQSFYIVYIFKVDWPWMNLKRFSQTYRLQVLYWYVNNMKIKSIPTLWLTFNFLLFSIQIVL